MCALTHIHTELSSSKHRHNPIFCIFCRDVNLTLVIRVSVDLLYSCAHIPTVNGARTPTHNHMHTYTHSHTHSDTHNQMCALTYIHTELLVCTHTHSQPCTHTHPQSHAHIRTPSKLQISKRVQMSSIHSYENGDPGSRKYRKEYKRLQYTGMRMKV